MLELLEFLESETLKLFGSVDLLSLVAGRQRGLAQEAHNLHLLD